MDNPTPSPEMRAGGYARHSSGRYCLLLSSKHGYLWFLRADDGKHYSLHAADLTPVTFVPGMVLERIKDGALGLTRLFTPELTEYEPGVVVEWDGNRNPLNGRYDADWRILHPPRWASPAPEQPAVDEDYAAQDADDDSSYGLPAGMSWPTLPQTAPQPPSAGSDSGQRVSDAAADFALVAEQCRDLRTLSHSRPDAVPLIVAVDIAAAERMVAANAQQARELAELRPEAAEARAMQELANQNCAEQAARIRELEVTLRGLLDELPPGNSYPCWHCDGKQHIGKGADKDACPTCENSPGIIDLTAAVEAARAALAPEQVQQSGEVQREL